MTEKKYTGRGGDRGGRRPKGQNKTTLSVRIDNDLYDKLKGEKNKSQVINDSLRKHYDAE